MIATALTLLSVAIGASSDAAPAPIAWLDFQKDGLPDVVTVTADGELRLHANRGDGSFDDRTVSLGLDQVRSALFVLSSDVDADGWPELFVGTVRGPSRFLEAGPTTFTDAADAFGLSAEGEDLWAAWTDVDADGKLDLWLEQAGGARVFLARDGRFVETEAPSLTSVTVEPWTNVSIEPEDEEPAADSEDTRGRSRRRDSAGSTDMQNVVVSGAPGVTAGSGGTGLGSPNACVPSLADQTGGPCIAASRVPTFGSFYPLGTDWFVEAGTGRVGFGTLSPGYALEVVGQAISGVGNSASGSESTIGGGSANNASGELAVIAGGEGNVAPGRGAFVGGGSFNFALSDRSAVQGGVGNRAAYRSFVGGGDNNGAFGNVSAVAGGKLNEAQQTGSFVGGGENSIANGTHATIAGGRDQLANGPDATIVGGANHEAEELAFVGGGGSSADPALGNKAVALRATIAGGVDNESDAEASFIGGGEGNRIFALSGATGAVIGGGENNIVGGGSGSTAVTLGGGGSNEARGDHATVLGGLANEATSVASTIGGGEGNTASGAHATVPGGRDNSAFQAFASGRRAKSLAPGSFVFADSTNADFQTLQPDHFFVRASGGVGIGTTTPTSPLTVAGSIESTSGGFVFPDGTTQVTAAIAALPSGGMIATQSPTPPPSFTSTGQVLLTTVIEETTPLAPLPDASSGQGCAVSEGQFSVIGGQGIAVPETIHRRYDPATDTWSTAAGFGAAWFATATLNDQIYVLGGLRLFPSTTFEDNNIRYSPVADQWTSLAPLQTARAYSTAEVVGGRIYVFGGANSVAVLGSVEEYDPVTDSWTSKAPMPTARQSARAAVLDGQIYVLGGSSGGSTTVVEVYDPATDTWSTAASMPFIPSGSFDVIARDGHLHVVTNIDLYEYHPQADYWLDKGPHGLAGVNTPCFQILDGVPHLLSLSKELWSIDVQNALLDLHRRD